MPGNTDSFNKARQQAIDQLKSSRKHQESVQALADEILQKDIRALSKGITLVESNQPEEYARGQALVSLLYPHSGKSMRIGITGVPGVGKSTFIETFGGLLTEQDFRVAVLAVDPSSQRSHGSILGDKTRMEALSVNPKAYIRPTPAAKALGGVARSTREAMVLCEAAGFDRIIIETVGVGQSETAVHSMTDFFLLLMLPGAGDELQGIKRGIMEMADLVAINKADGANLEAARKAKRAYKNALHLFPPGDDGWIPRVLTCSALEKQSLEPVLEALAEHDKEMIHSGRRDTKRADQALFWFNNTLEELWHQYLNRHETFGEKKKSLESAVRNGEKSPFQAAGELMDQLR